MNEVLARCLRELESGDAVLDVGCIGFQQVANGHVLGLELAHAGVDCLPPPTALPERFTYRQADLDCAPIPFPDDSFDLVVAAHLIEHLRRPVEAVSECVRVCKPGGQVYIEAPSERSTWLPGMPFWRNDLRSLSFYDDPTHVGRPWTPQALHRLARYLGCEPEEVRHLSSWRVRLALPLLVAGALVRRRSDIFEWAIWNAVGWASCAVIRKPASLTGAPELTYYTRQH